MKGSAFTTDPRTNCINPASSLFFLSLVTWKPEEIFTLCISLFLDCLSLSPHQSRSLYPSASINQLQCYRPSLSPFFLSFPLSFSLFLFLYISLGFSSNTTPTTASHYYNVYCCFCILDSQRCFFSKTTFWLSK